ncbi:hypothetical protein [Streptomyces venezuelae]|uniref:hypothetical protein n=1 Tax=Streptomyces venezuelae TaxID=54571 RepID=UPI0037D75413
MARPRPRRRRPGEPEGLAAEEPVGLLWDLHPGYVLHPGDRLVVAATRAGLAELLGEAAPSRRTERRV